MTPTEAATDAFMTVHASGTRSTASPGLARYFLAALPPGWRLCGPDDVTVTAERLGVALEDIQGPYGDSALDDYLRRKGRLNVAAAILAALSADKGGDTAT